MSTHDDMYNTTRRILAMENTRPIYDGIAELNRQLLSLTSKGSDGSSVEEMLRAIHLRDECESINVIRGIVKGIIKDSYDDKGLILQNPNYGFLSFWEKRFNSPPKGDDSINAITDMMLYLSLLDCIRNISYQEGNKERDDLPYLYENLCGAILKIVGCENCFIVHHMSCGDTHIVARSAFLEKEITEQNEMTVSNIADRLKTMQKPEHAAGLYFGEPILDQNDGKYYVLIHLFSSSFSGDKFYILLTFAPGSAEPDSDKLVKFLFARYHLKEVISRDYEHLLNLRYELGFVRFFKEGNPDETRYPVIIHASDLHADRLGENGKKPELLVDKWKACGAFTGDIDLLVISGDFVNAKRSNASDIQKSYDYASRIIRKLAYELWGAKGRISFDWKRRIILVPGNHDFAAMNLVKAIFKQRTLAAGLPYDGENKVVAKFAYYLDFLLELLDPPIDQLIRDEINEVREYRRMHTKVLMLNSSYDASPDRTNKVRINEDIVKRLTGSEMWEDCSHADRSYRVCVVHHPPFETIDYVLDGYDADDILCWKWDKKEKASSPINILYDKTIEIIKTANKEYSIGEFKDKKGRDYVTEYEKETKAMEDDPNLRDVKTINQEGDKKGKHFFTKDAKILYDYCKEGAEKERAQKIISDINFNMHIAEEDQKEFDDCIQKYVFNADVILSGHVHAKNTMDADLSFDDARRKKHDEMEKIVDMRMSIVGKTFGKDAVLRTIKVSDKGDSLEINDYSI